MRVLWIIPGFAENEVDENCIPTVQLLAKALKTHTVDITIITLDYPVKQPSYKWNGIHVINIAVFKSKILIKLHWFKALRKCMLLHKHKPFDLIHSFWIGPAYLTGRLVSCYLKIPHVTTLMGQDALSTNKYLWFLEKNNTNHSLVAVSEFHARIFKKNTGIDIHRVIHWGVEEYEENINRPIRDIDVIGCGSLITLKNWPLWISVVEGAIKKYPLLKAMLVGGGVLHDQLKQIIQEKNLGSNIFLTNEMPRSEVLKMMRRSKVLLHTSTYESFGLVILEAYMQECKIVSTPTGISTELGNTATSIQELTSLLLKSLENPDFSFPQKSPWTLDRLANDYIHLYSQKTANNP